MTSFGINPITPEDFFGQIEDRLQEYLLANANLPKERAFLSLVTDDQHIQIPAIDKFVTITPLRFPPWQGVVSGGADTGFDVAFRTTTFTRLTNDQELRASRILRDPQNGILSTMFWTCKAFQMWTMPVDPEDPTNASYLREPMRIVGSGPELTTKKQPANVWVLCWCTWEAKATFIQNPDTLVSTPVDPPTY